MHHVKAVVVAAFGLAAFSSAAQAPPSGAPVSRQPAPIDIVAVVGSAPITLAEVDEKAMQEFQCQQLVNLARIVAVSLEVALYDCLHTTSLEVGPSQRPGVEQDFSHVV